MDERRIMLTNSGGGSNIPVLKVESAFNQGSGWVNCADLETAELVYNSIVNQEPCLLYTDTKFYIAYSGNERPARTYAITAIKFDNYISFIVPYSSFADESGNTILTHMQVDYLKSGNVYLKRLTF